MYEINVQNMLSICWQYYNKNKQVFNLLSVGNAGCFCEGISDKCSRLIRYLYHKEFSTDRLNTSFFLFLLHTISFDVVLRELVFLCLDLFCIKF